MVESMDYEHEIKRLRRLNMKMYFTLTNIINILNERESNELYKLSMKSIDKDIIFNDDYEIYERINNLEEEFKKLKNKLYNKYFEYSDCESDSDSCGCGKEPQKQCEEIEEYLKKIKMVD
jgi:hypothetical protein